MKPKITRELTDAEVVGALLDNINTLMGDNQVLRESRDALVAREQDMRVLNEQLKAEVAAEKARADKAEAACEEMREHLIRISSTHRHLVTQEMVSANCGTGFLSPEVAKKVRGLLEPILRNGEVAPHSDTATRIAQALALLDQK